MQKETSPLINYILERFAEVPMPITETYEFASLSTHLKTTEEYKSIIDPEGEVLEELLINLRAIIISLSMDMINDKLSDELDFEIVWELLQNCSSLKKN